MRSGAVRYFIQWAGVKKKMSKDIVKVGDKLEITTTEISKITLTKAELEARKAKIEKDLLDTNALLGMLI